MCEDSYFTGPNFLAPWSSRVSRARRRTSVMFRNLRTSFSSEKRQKKPCPDIWPKIWPKIWSNFGLIFGSNFGPKFWSNFEQILANLANLGRSGQPSRRRCHRLSTAYFTASNYRLPAPGIFGFWGGGIST